MDLRLAVSVRNPNERSSDAYPGSICDAAPFGRFEISVALAFRAHGHHVMRPSARLGQQRQIPRYMLCSESSGLPLLEKSIGELGFRVRPKRASSKKLCRRACSKQYAPPPWVGHSPANVSLNSKVPSGSAFSAALRNRESAAALPAHY